MFYYWPQGSPLEETLAAFVRAFATLGFIPCNDDTLEPGFEKIAIYVNSQGKPTHAARQLHNGRWSSKLGNEVDIEHAHMLLQVVRRHGTTKAAMDLVREGLEESWAIERVWKGLLHDMMAEHPGPK